MAAENNELAQFILQWNAEHPWDRIWRKKHNIPFGSAEHRSMGFIDMAIDLFEDFVIKEKFETQDDEISEDIMVNGEMVHLPGAPKDGPKKYVKPTAREVDDVFDKIDIKELNKQI